MYILYEELFLSMIISRDGRNQGAQGLKKRKITTINLNRLNLNEPNGGGCC